MAAQNWFSSKLTVYFSPNYNGDRAVEYTAFIDQIKASLQPAASLDRFHDSSDAEKTVETFNWDANVHTPTDVHNAIINAYNSVTDWLQTTRLEIDASSDPSAPEDGFLFKTKGTPAAAVIAQRTDGKSTPIYISPVLLPPAGRLGASKSITTPTVAIWFQMDVINRTMIESDKSDLYIVALQGTTAKAAFNKDGFWGPGKNLDD
ncbi:MAG: hypothetical protein Q9166_006092 [cf. Caloplaca sp. 2 TL-2023]